MKEEWLFPNAIVPVDVETTAVLVAEIKRLIDVVGGLVWALSQTPDGSCGNLLFNWICTGDAMNIIELAQKCQLIGMRPQEALEKFADLVAAQEREACCVIVYEQCESDNVAQRTVDAIRARGTT